MSDIKTRKATTRKAAFASRKAARTEAATANAIANLLKHLLPHKGAPLAGYLPIQTEVDPVPVMASMAAFGPVCVPVIQGAAQPLKFRQWTPGCAMEAGPFGVQVPVSGAWITPELLIVPLLAFNANAMRLGYGGGYYDRTLEGLRRHGPVLAIGYAFQAQMVKDLPLESTDQPLDGIITDTGLITP